MRVYLPSAAICKRCAARLTSKFSARRRKRKQSNALDSPIRSNAVTIQAKRRSFIGTKWLASIGYAQTTGPARALINQARYRSDLDRRLFGSFLEHLGRAVYTGVYEPGSKLADANGFRKDVMAEIKGLGVPIMRYPGGNFVSGYNWLDGVGPKDKRPTVLERAWNSLETNQFGTNEFIEWCKLVNTEPLLGFNLGTGTPEMAVAYVEYCNVDKGTKWSDLRRAHGYEQPHNVKYWCMGNEMDGPWQMGHMTAREYGRKARDAARQIRVIDPDTKLIACGSSNTILPTYLVWDREVLEECYDQVDGISLHNYYGNTEQLTGNRQRPLSRDESGHGAADPRNRRRLRLRAGAAEVAQTSVAVVRRMEHLVSRPQRALPGRQTGLRAEAAGRGVQPRRRVAGRRVREHACCASPSACAWGASPRSSTSSPRW